MKQLSKLNSLKTSDGITTITSLNIDIETYSPEDLKKVGVYKYAAHKDFKILMMAYKINGASTLIMDLSEREIPYSILYAIFDQNVKKYAFNAMFERVCLSYYIKKEQPDFLESDFLHPGSWYCTAAHSSYLGLPHKLGDVGQVLHLKEVKDPAGTHLINYFCNPSRTKGRDRNLPEHAPEKWEEFKAYCVQDVNSEYAIKQVCDIFPLPERERQIYILDQLINDRGVRIDYHLLKEALVMDENFKRKTEYEIINKTGIENPNSYNQLKKWLEQQGFPMLSLDKEHVKNALSVLQPGYQDHIKEVLIKRQLLGKTATKKFAAIKRSIINDIIRGMFGYYRARTGRFTSHIVQLHNLKTTGDLTHEDLTEYRKQVKHHTLSLDDNFPDILSKLVRTSFIPRKAKKFLVVDFSAIEARVLAWLAGETWRLDLFKSGGKLYEETASRITGIAVDEITKESHERKIGKVAELALGYQGGVKALQAMEKSTGSDLGMDEDQLNNVKDMWRGANYNICQYWYNCQEAFMMAIMGHTTTIGDITFSKGPGVVCISLPVGRHLFYILPKIEYDEEFERDCITYMGLNSMSHKWERLKTYGGKIVENITQAVARDCLTEVMLRFFDKEIVLHVHDEIVLEVDKNETIDRYIEIFEKPINWAKGLPLKADGYFSDFYKK